MDLWNYTSQDARCFSVVVKAPTGSMRPEFFCRDGYSSGEELARAAAEYAKRVAQEGAHVLYGVLPLSRRPERGRGSAEDVAVAGWLFADLDYKDPTTVDAPPFEGCHEGDSGKLECYYNEEG
ncbi:MAG: hypothetical protein ACP5G6_09265, partial [Conexivisphaera sp.]